MVNWVKRRKLLLAGLLILVLLLSQVQVVDEDSAASGIQIGVGDKRVITLGSVALAAGTVDYEFDGVADDIQFQAAMDALPAAGGRLVVVSAVQINFTALTTVTRAIGEVTIEGSGLGTTFVGDGVTAIFTAGGNSWVLSNFATDAGSVVMGATTGWAQENLLLGADYIAYATADNITAADWAIPVGRGATFTVAASDSTADEIAQADYVCNGVDDDVQIQAALDALGGSPGTVRAASGIYRWSTGTVIMSSSNQTLDMSQALIHYSGTGNAIEMTSHVSQTRLSVGTLRATGAAFTSATATGIYVLGQFNVVIEGKIEDFRSGTGIVFDSDAGTSMWTGVISVPMLFVKYCKVGIELAGDYNTHDIFFEHLWWTAVSNNSYGIRDTTTYAGHAQAIHVGSFYAEVGAYTGNYSAYFQGSGVQIDSFVQDGGAGNTSIYSAQPIVIGSTRHTVEGYSQLNIPNNSVVLERTAQAGSIMGSPLLRGSTFLWMPDNPTVAYDVSGNGYDGTVTAAPSATSVGKLDAVTLNGTTQDISVANVSMNGNRTVVIVTRTAFNYNHAGTIRFFDWYLDGNNSMGLSSSGSAMTLLYRGGGASVTLQTDNQPRYSSGDVLVTMVTMDSATGTATLYMNGDLIGAGTGAGAVSSTASTLYYGSSTGASEWFPGDASLFGVFPYVFSHDEVSDLTRYFGNQAGTEYLFNGESKTFITTVAYNSASPVNCAAVSDGYAVTDVWAEIVTTFDGAGLTLDIGDGAGDVGGFLPNASINDGVGGYYGLNWDDRGTYLWDAVNNHPITHVYTGADTVDCTITNPGGTQGVVIVYTKVTRIGG